MTHEDKAISMRDHNKEHSHTHTHTHAMSLHVYNSWRDKYNSGVKLCSKDLNLYMCSYDGSWEGNWSSSN